MKQLLTQMNKDFLQMYSKKIWRAFRSNLFSFCFFFFHKVFLFMMLHIFKVRNRNFATELEVISTFGPQGKDNSLNDHITPEIRNFLIQI